MLIATALALAIRLFTLTRPGFLTGVTEYDDGVYIGGSIRITEGQLPYLNFAFVQPPGILELMLPVALLAKVTSVVKALAVARLLTALASTACIPLVGNLVRYRGAVVTAVACGVLAVYPPDITTAHTLLLEPWMNMFCLIAINLAFRRGHLARRPCWAGPGSCSASRGRLSSGRPRPRWSCWCSASCSRPTGAAGSATTSSAW